MPTPPGLAGKWKDVIKPKEDNFPYEWTRSQKPANKKGQRCRIIGTMSKSQGLVAIEFSPGGGVIYTVVKKGLKKVG